MSRSHQRRSPLRVLRDGAKLTAEQVAERLASALGEESRTYVSVIQIEHRGTRDTRIIKALAEIYAVSRNVVESAAEETKQAAETVKNYNNLSSIPLTEVLQSVIIRS